MRYCNTALLVIADHFSDVSGFFGKLSFINSFKFAVCSNCNKISRHVDVYDQLYTFNCGSQTLNNARFGALNRFEAISFESILNVCDNAFCCFLFHKKFPPSGATVRPAPGFNIKRARDCIGILRKDIIEHHRKPATVHTGSVS